MTETELDPEYDAPNSTQANRAAIDFETYEWVHPYCFSLAWGPPGQREHFYSIDLPGKNPRGLATHALETMWCTQAEHDIQYWYAHNGGKFDFLALAEAAAFHDWEVSFTAAVDGRIIEAKFWPPNRTKTTKAVTVRDSMCLVASALKHKHTDCRGQCQGCIVCDFHLEKAVFTVDDYKTDVRTWDKQRLKEGCIKDSMLLLDMLDKLESFATENGAPGLGITASKTALDIAKAFLTVEGITLPSHGDRYATHRNSNQRLNVQARESYSGGRVEPYQHAPTEELCELDVTSSYPWAMCQTMPWEVLGNEGGPKMALAVLDNVNGLEGVIQARVHVPKESWLPPLPVRVGADKTLFYPTGTFTGWWPANELRYAREECGVRVEPLQAVAYTPARPFEALIRRLFHLKSVSRGAARAFYKIVLNSIYGKFAQAPEREMLRMCATPYDAQRLLMPQSMGGLPKWKKPKAVGEPPRFDESLNRWVGGRVVKWEETAWPAHTHFAMASYITAYSRIHLHRAMSLVGFALCYTDTDSLHFHRSALPKVAHLIGEGLGQWKLEIDSMRGRFYGPKIYLLTEALCPTGKATGTNCEAHPKGLGHYAAKGFTHTPPAFLSLIRGEDIRRESMRLIKGQLRGDGTFQRKVTTKRWHGASRKRRPLFDGFTVPWTYEELEAGKYQEALSPAPLENMPEVLALDVERALQNA